METQNFKNHSRIIPGFHVALYLILIVCLVGSIWNLIKAFNNNSAIIMAVLLFLLTIAAILLTLYSRRFALIAQDRAIRAEENLRHFVLTGKLPDSRLTIDQIIALRFAEDTEFTLLAEKAANENMKPTAIKKAIINWKPDEYRV
jgi:hypothetical protein